MNAKELRIGNWVYEFGTYSKIKSGHDIDLMADNFQPIPLTPEILEKCGFEKKHNTHNYAWYFELKDYKIEMWIVAGDMCKCTITKEMFDADFEIKLPDCNYLHQLQNLYFALTGEELEVNL